VTSQDRVLPHSLDAEMSVLGCLLVESQRFVDIADVLRAEDFFRDAHRRIFEAAKTLHDRGRGIDFITLKEELSRRGDLEAVDGPAYLARLTNGVPRGVNLPHYAAIVGEKAQRRRLISAANKMLQDAYEGERSIEELIEEAEADVLTVGKEATGSDFVMADQWVRETYEHLERLANDPRQVTGVSTGFQDLDRMTRGLQPGDLIILGARPSMGKTALASQMALNMATQAMVGLFSVEMARLAL
jgi:replicative DNA helicase